MEAGRWSFHGALVSGCKLRPWSACPIVYSSGDALANDGLMGRYFDAPLWLWELEVREFSCQHGMTATLFSGTVSRLIAVAASK